MESVFFSTIPFPIYSNVSMLARAEKVGPSRDVVYPLKQRERQIKRKKRGRKKKKKNT